MKPLDFTPGKAGAAVALFTSSFVATRELLTYGSFNPWGVMLAGALAFALAFGIIAAWRQWSQSPSSGV